MEFGTQLTVSVVVPQFIGTGGFNSSSPTVPRLINGARTVTTLRVGVDAALSVGNALTAQAMRSSDQGATYNLIGSPVTIPALGMQNVVTFAAVSLAAGDRIVIRVFALLGTAIGGFSATLS